MAYQLVWTKRALQGYESIVQYLEQQWTDKEVENFILESADFFELLIQYPSLLQRSHTYKNVYRGPMNKLTIITYRVKTRKHEIEIINIRGARQKPLK
jgi:plasmid stabilization system protein ParE